MEVYLVGGAVRDQLLGIEPHERDWVVVGATSEEMQQLGYRPVGREFPVFLHPKTQEEYALARLERKVAPGYRGFVTESSPRVTLVEDLQRRDLTINAMARSNDGALIDPYGGLADLEARLLRHVSPAFVEDPVRILRVARFAARFAPLGFTVVPETSAVMRQMVVDGEADALVPERVWREVQRALGTTQPDRFFSVLQKCGALASVLPEIALLLSTEPTASLAIAALRTAALKGDPVSVRWAAMLADLDSTSLETLSERLRMPSEYRELALLAVLLGAQLHGEPRPDEPTADAARILALLETADAFRRPERFQLWLAVLTARAEAHGIPKAVATNMAAGFAECLRLATIRLSENDLATFRGPQLAQRLRELRLTALAARK